MGVLSEVGGMFFEQKDDDVSGHYKPVNWWTENLGYVLSRTSYRISYALVWRNEFNAGWSCFAPAIVDTSADKIIKDICQLEDFLQWTNDAANNIGLLYYNNSSPKRNPLQQPHSDESLSDGIIAPSDLS